MSDQLVDQIMRISQAMASQMSQAAVLYREGISVEEEAAGHRAYGAVEGMTYVASILLGPNIAQQIHEMADRRSMDVEATPLILPPFDAL